MTIIYSKKVKPSSLAKIKRSDAFIALVTENFVKEEGRIDECRIAKACNKPMYAMVKEGIEWNLEFEFPWRKIYYYKRLEEEGREITEDIQKDLGLYKAVQGFDGSKNVQ